MEKVAWTRKEIKNRAKTVLKKNYWKMVLVCFILKNVLDSGYIFSGSMEPITDLVNKISSKIKNPFGIKEKFMDQFLKFSNSTAVLKNEEIQKYKIMGMIGLAAVVLIIILFVVGVLMASFIFNPLLIGCIRFFDKAYITNPKLKEVFFAFENKYKNVVIVMFLRELYIFLWSLLFIVPGFIKSYETMLIPYILADNPAIDQKEAFAMSRRLMEGQKGKAFIFDLSFLGWCLLSGLTFGFLGIAFVIPYEYLAKVGLCRKLCGLDNIPDNIYYEGMDHQNRVDENWY